MSERGSDLHYSYARWIVVLLVLGALLGIFLCSLLAFQKIGHIESGSFKQFVGYVGMVFCAACLLLLLWSFFSTKGPVITITDSGIRDVRLAAEEIPWVAVHGVGTAILNRQKFVMLAVEPVVEERLTLTRMARWTREPNRKLGFDALCVSVMPLNVDHATFSAVCEAQARKGREKLAKEMLALNPPSPEEEQAAIEKLLISRIIP